MVPASRFVVGRSAGLTRMCRCDRRGYSLAHHHIMRSQQGANGVAFDAAGGGGGDLKLPRTNSGTLSIDSDAEDNARCVCALLACRSWWAPVVTMARVRSR